MWRRRACLRPLSGWSEHRAPAGCCGAGHSKSWRRSRWSPHRRRGVAGTGFSMGPEIPACSLQDRREQRGCCGVASWPKSAPQCRRARRPTCTAKPWLSAAKPLRAASGPDRFPFLEKIAFGRVAIAHRGPRDVAGWSMVSVPFAPSAEGNRSFSHHRILGKT